jgi:bacterial/archaeal transporter family protein
VRGDAERNGRRPVMPQWLVWSLSAALLWGLWAFFSKLAVRDATPIVALLWFMIGQAVTTAALILWNRPLPSPGMPAAVFALASGVAGVLATLAFFAALRHAAVAVVLPLTAVYPVVAIVLGVLVLGERMTIPQAAGASLAIAAVVLLSL